MISKWFPRAAFAAALVMGAAALPGCGGGGGGSSATGGASGTGTVQSFGALIAHVVGTTQPPVIGGSGSTVVTGIGGATVTSLQSVQPASLASTLIAFDRQGEVYTIGPDGSNPTEVTSDLITYSNSTEPAWGVNGVKIVYMRYDSTNGHFQIYSANPDGTSPIRLTDGTSNCFDPCVSPNGTVLFDQYTTSNGALQIYSVGIGGGAITRLSAAASVDSDPSWSPDGAKYAYMHYDPSATHDQIYIANANGSGAHSANTNYTSYDFMQPAWSPDGTKIAFVWKNGSNYHIYEMSALGLTPIQALTNAAYDDFSPAWAPDGSKIVFQRTDGTGKPQIYTANPDGTQAIRLTDGATVDQSPAWSPIVTRRNLVGSGLALGTTAAGFFYAQQGDVITSIVTFNATTPSGVTIAALPTSSPELPNIVFTVSASDSLTSLIYLNGLSSRAVVAVGAGSPLASASNAIVSFNSATGRVASVLPFSASHIVKGSSAATGALTSHLSGGAIVIDGKFLSALDGTGHNHAPQGATEVRIDSHTGALLGVS